MVVSILFKFCPCVFAFCAATACIGTNLVYLNATEWDTFLHHT